MELKNFFKNSSNDTYNDNMDILEEYDLVNPLGSPNKLFLKFLKSKKLDIKKDKITKELIEEFDGSTDSTNIRLEKIQRQKDIIFNNRKVWINVIDGEETLGSDLDLNSEDIFIEETGQKIAYTDIYDIEVTDGGWSKNRFTIYTKNEDEVVFDVNENMSVALREILEDNISHQNYDEISELLDLYSQFEDGLISEEELELRKAVIYSDDRFCTNCGAKIDFDSEFCSSCGEKVER